MLYVPSLRKNLFSVEVCTANEYKVTFGDKKVTHMRKDTVEINNLKKNNNMYIMLFKVIEQKCAGVNVSVTSLR